MINTQIPIKSETRKRLKMLKAVTFSDNYDETIDKLIESSGYQVPEDEEEAKRLFAERMEG